MAIDHSCGALTSFFQADFSKIVDSPNGLFWWHNLPLPDGSHIRGTHPADLQFKMWRALQIPDEGGLSGKRVLDIGANDGFFTLAALAAGARHVTAINSDDWPTWPRNIRYACETWGAWPEIVTADFRTYDFEEPFDVIFCFGVIYHLEDVFRTMKLLGTLLANQGVLYIETQMTTIQSDLPIFEYSSDIYPTVVRQDKAALNSVGISNYLLPNEHAIYNLAYSYDFECTPMDGPHSRYTQENPTRRFFKLIHRHVRTGQDVP